MWISGHQYHSNTSHNVPSLPWCALCSSAASTTLHLLSVFSSTNATSSSGFCFWQSSHSGATYIVGSSWHSCISIGDFLPCHFRFLTNSHISIHLPVYSLDTYDPRNDSYALSIMFLSSSCSSCIPHNLTSIISSRSLPSSAPGSPSHHGSGERLLQPPVILLVMCFMSKWNGLIHAIQQESFAPGRLLARKFSWCTKVLVSVSTDLIPYA